MKILFLNQFFWPDSSATSQLLTDLARGLAARGHQVSVICAEGGYASAAAEEPPAVRIERVKAHRFNRGRFGRVLSYLSFYVGAFFRSCISPRADVVVSLTTPPLICLLGSWVKALKGSRHLIWEMDLYPDVAVDLEHFSAGGLPDRLTGALADFSRRNADGLLALGECMKRRLVARGVPSSKIFIAENWADSTAIRPREKSGGAGQLVVLYSGNLGLAHDLDTIVESITCLREDERFQFLFVGGGARRAELAHVCSTRHLDSVELRPYAPRHSLGASLALGDIGLVTQRDVCCGSVVPSKVYGILAAGRPILFIGPKEATPARIIKAAGCGWQVDCGDVATLTALLLHLAEHKDEVVLAGERARQTLVERYDITIGVANIAAILERFQVPSVRTKSPDRAALYPTRPQTPSKSLESTLSDEGETVCPLCSL